MNPPLSLCSLKSLCAIYSISKIENEAIRAALETSEASKEWRSFVVIHVMKIAVVREIDRIQADANLVPAPALQERQVQMKISISLRIEGKESREARAIWHPCVILKHIHVGVGKACMDVNHWAHGEGPWEMDHAPTDHAMGHV